MQSVRIIQCFICNAQAAFCTPVEDAELEKWTLPELQQELTMRGVVKLPKQRKKARAMLQVVSPYYSLTIRKQDIKRVSLWEC